MESHMTAMHDVGRDYRDFSREGSRRLAWQNLQGEFTFTLKACALQKTLGYMQSMDFPMLSSKSMLLQSFKSHGLMPLA